MTDQQMKYLGIVILTCTGLFLLSVPFLLHSTPPKPQSTLVLSPTTTPSPTPFVEPAVLSWQTYSNDTYQFSIDYPADWKTQEYHPQGINAGLVVAFSPDSLPCGSCTYTTEGYYSIHVYNQTSDPLLYNKYQEILKNLDNSKTDRKVTLDGTEGVLHGNTISLDHNGWIYELSFDRSTESITLTNSKIFLHAAGTFAFTNLKFIK